MKLTDIELELKTLSARESRAVVGGIQPQPLPPEISSALVQPDNILLRGIVIGSIVIGS